MNAVYSIIWFVCLLISSAVIYELIGYAGLTRMFPEGRRWWHLPAQFASLALFAAVVLYHPFEVTP